MMIPTLFVAGDRYPFEASQRMHTDVASAELDRTRTAFC